MMLHFLETTFVLERRTIVASTLQYRSRNSAMQRRAGDVGVMLIVLLLTVLATSLVQAQTFTTLHSFAGAAGEYPVAGLIVDAAGNLYGTTQQGGAHGLGTVFKVDSTAGTETVLHSFKGGKSDGAFPSAGLAVDSKGNVYGTTTLGGRSNHGTVFKVTATATVVYSFTGTKGDGAYPIAGLVADAADNVYGTTQQGGTHGFGTVFELSAAGKEKVLYSFKGVPDGEYPCAGLILDAKGNLYGTTQLGGPASQNDGTVFKVDKAGKETVLYSFTDANGDGAYPFGGVVRDKAANLYGTASDGGANGIGIVFKLDKAGKESVLYSFGTNKGDGAYPFAGLVMDAKGNLYGTAELGGANGPGAIFEVTPSGVETILHSFDGTDGADPLAGLVQDSAGNLYGTTTEGGAHNNGVVFKLTP
jgi:uncharacterized repeat protein (TIGR03803 family)